MSTSLVATLACISYQLSGELRQRAPKARICEPKPPGDTDGAQEEGEDGNWRSLVIGHGWINVPILVSSVVIDHTEANPSLLRIYRVFVVYCSVLTRLNV